MASHYNELMSTYKNYCNAFDSLYQLKTKDENEIAAIYKNLKVHLIDSNKYPPNHIISDISFISKYKNLCMKSFLAIAKQIFDEYHPNTFVNIYYAFDYLFYKEYGIVLQESNKRKFKECETKNYSSDIHEANTIYRAIMDDDKELFISLIERCEFDKKQKLKNDLYPPNKDGYSYLELCCYYGSVDCFKFLITKFHSKITQQCLHLSFLGGNQEILSECLKCQRPTKECMRYAIASHNIDFVSFLNNEYDIKIDVDYCRLFNNLHALLVYLDQTNDIDTCFVVSPIFHLLSLCKYFISHGAKIDAKYSIKSTPLHLAVLSNSKEIVEFLISHGANIKAKDGQDDTPLHYAALLDCKEAAEVLISHGADIDAKNDFSETPLHYAAGKNSKEIAEVLLVHGANINAGKILGETPLHVAAENNSVEAIKVLISHGGNVNIRNGIKGIPLHCASKSNNKEMVEFLISRDANINAGNGIGDTPLHVVVKDNNKEMAEFLISHGANINAGNDYPRTPLYEASLMNNKEMVEFLISHGANINATGALGNTPLHAVVEDNNKEMAEFLISHGANINATNNYHETPLYFASQKNNKEMIKFLISHGAKQ
ncbi:ankyrin repeat protein, putative [Trichomonas vaginalis G3]|uniref:Ankyrin repeat protein, putative n=1 Tax=Trichomonas vaginalis (strain ATCC PRA-98 / G3) TaxID=412133 RepID=A2E1H4_TRIV3|nr:cyclin-dependent kinase inhibitor 2C-related family [Trichomonas vaginalis G3]EAY13541.1 ankyrin repeat protein, putative [Trichomonas vaginalis G3]KAI5529183.1 cyclin-dependent kinase inhibitor 2C-related family [Trichomonas vaginalis G3]|eukprot:XP_001325764.1 ankyrin repeat protein [Trichomonas vaginalis G3]